MKKTSILIVDDHPAIRSTMLDILDEEGFSAEQAVDGKEALAQCLKNEYELQQTLLARCRDSYAAACFNSVVKSELGTALHAQHVTGDVGKCQTFLHHLRQVGFVLKDDDDIEVPVTESFFDGGGLGVEIRAMHELTQEPEPSSQRPLRYQEIESDTETESDSSSDGESS